MYLLEMLLQKQLAGSATLYLLHRLDIGPDHVCWRTDLLSIATTRCRIDEEVVAAFSRTNSVYTGIQWKLGLDLVLVRWGRYMLG